MIQTASARPFVAEVWVRSRPSSCVISGTRSGPGTRFPPSTSVSPVGTTAPMPHVHIHPDMSSEGRADEAWRPSNKAVLFRILGRPLVYRMSSHFLTYSDICQALVCPPPPLFRGHFVAVLYHVNKTRLPRPAWRGRAVWILLVIASYARLPVCRTPFKIVRPSVCVSCCTDCNNI